MIITEHAYARVGLIGNPSDGFFGKTIAFTFDAFKATVTLWETPELIIEPHEIDRSRYTSMQNLVDDVYFVGYYGGERLIKATLKSFTEYIRRTGSHDLTKNFTIRYNTSIPMRVGLAGSSAIIIATLRGLMRFYGISIPSEELATLALRVETVELGIHAGLQDRVAQVYQGMMYMDFNRQYMNDYGHGLYERMDISSLPPLFIAYCTDMSEGTEVAHSNLHYRFDKGDLPLRRAMKRLAKITDSMRIAIEDGREGRMHQLINENFDIRASIVPIAPMFREMVNIARNCGACAKFCGSGGAIVGIADESIIRDIRRELEPLNVKTITPNILGSNGEALR